MAGDLTILGNLELDDIIMNLWGTPEGVIGGINHYLTTAENITRSEEDIISHLVTFEGLTQTQSLPFNKHVMGYVENTEGNGYIALHENRNGIREELYMLSPQGKVSVHNFDHFMPGLSQVESLVGLTHSNNTIIAAVETHFQGPTQEYTAHSRLVKIGKYLTEKVTIRNRTDIEDQLIMQGIVSYKEGHLIGFGEKRRGKITFVNHHNEIEWSHPFEDGVYALTADAQNNIYVGINRPTANSFEWKGTIHVLNEKCEEIAHHKLEEGILALAHSGNGTMYAATTNDFRKNKSHLVQFKPLQ